MIGMYINDHRAKLKLFAELDRVLGLLHVSSWILHLTLHLPEVISKYFLPMVSIHYPANR